MNCKIFLNRSISDVLMNEVLILKDQSWKYGIDSQRNWVSENLEDDDIHFCCFDESGVLLAYANLVNRKIFIGDQHENVLGIGNVCVREKNKGMGFGSELMRKINNYLLVSKKIGILLCKEQLVSFYASLGWSQIPTDLIEVSFLSEGSKIFAFNSNYSRSVKIRLDGKSF